MQLLKVLQQSCEQLPRVAWQPILPVLENLRYALRQVSNTLGYHDPELREQPPDLIRLRGARLHKTLARPMQGQHRLLLWRFHRHEPHIGSLHRLADRLRIARIALVRFYIRLHELRRHQLHGMPKRHQLTCPVMRTRARFHPDQAGREIGKELCDLSSLELFAHHHLPPFVDTVNLKDGFSQINSNRSNLHLGRSLSVSGYNTLPLWHTRCRFG